MEAERIIKPSFAVIGLEGSTRDGRDIVKQLWENANARFAEIEALALRGADGGLMGIWGAMSDFSRSYKPWDNGFSEGLYLAGIEADADAEPPEGFTKWILPGFEYVRADGSFADGLEYLDSRGLHMIAAAQDFTDPKTGKNYILFPIRRL